MAAISTKLNGFGSCGCDHWRDARTMWIIGWIALAATFAVIVFARRARAHRRAISARSGEAIDISAKRRGDADGTVTWSRGVVRIGSASLRWLGDVSTERDSSDPSDEVGVPGVIEAGSLRRGPAVGASQFPFTMSVIALMSGAEVTLAVRPGDDVVLVECDRRFVDDVIRSSTWEQ